MSAESRSLLDEGGNAALPIQDYDLPRLGTRVKGRGSAAVHGGLGWRAASATVTAIILGLGVLGIPEAFAKVGWVLGFFLLILSASGAVYSGLLIEEICAVVSSSEAGRPLTYGDLGRAAYGSRGEAVTRAVQYTFLAGCIVAVQITASKSLSQVTNGLCVVSSNVIIAVVMVPVMQIQTLKEVTWVAVLGVVSIIIPIIIYLAEIAQADVVRGNSTGPTAGLPEATGVLRTASGLSTMAFAYSESYCLAHADGRSAASLQRGTAQWQFLKRPGILTISISYPLSGPNDFP